MMKNLINKHLTLPPLQDKKTKEIMFVFNEKNLLALMEDVAKISWSRGQLAKYYEEHSEQRPEKTEIMFRDFWDNKIVFPFKYVYNGIPWRHTIILKNKDKMKLTDIAAIYKFIDFSKLYKFIKYNIVFAKK